MSRCERIELLELDRGEVPISTQASLLGINKSGIYYRGLPPSAEEVAIKHRIDEIYTAYPFYGSRRITVTLKNDGIPINRKRVQRYMREMGIEGIHPGPNLSKRDLQHRIYPYLLRDVKVEHPDHVWGIDITYIRLLGGWMYLVAVIDWHSRFIVSWELDQTLEMGFVTEAVTRALGTGIPSIFNSDQGSHFTSPRYIDLLKDKKVLISMDGKGRAIDNVFIERFWRSLKYEEVYLKEYSSPREARSGIREYIDFYNNLRPHQSLDYQTPASVYLINRRKESPPCAPVLFESCCDRPMGKDLNPLFRSQDLNCSTGHKVEFPDINCCSLPPGKLEETRAFIDCNSRSCQPSNAGKPAINQLKFFQKLS